MRAGGNQRSIRRSVHIFEQEIKELYGLQEKRQPPYNSEQKPY